MKERTITQQEFRAEVVAHVKHYCAIYGVDHFNAWKRVYDGFKRSHNTDLVKAAQQRKMKTLDYAELMNHCGKLYVVAQATLPCDRAPSFNTQQTVQRGLFEG